MFLQLGVSILSFLWHCDWFWTWTGWDNLLTGNTIWSMFLTQNTIWSFFYPPQNTVWSVFLYSWGEILLFVRSPFRHPVSCRPYITLCLCSLARECSTLKWKHFQHFISCHWVGKSQGDFENNCPVYVEGLLGCVCHPGGRQHHSPLLLIWMLMRTQQHCLSQLFVKIEKKSRWM